MSDQPILLCTGPDAGVAAAEARQAAALLTRRHAVVLCAWAPPSLPFSPLAAAWDVVFEPPDELAAAHHRAATEAAHAACEVLAAAGWTAEPWVVRDDRHPHRVILESADEVDAALIVVGAREHADGHPGSLGRVTRALAHHARRPMLVLPPDGVEPDSDAPALVAFDGSHSAGHALDLAARLLAPRAAIVATAWEPCPAVVAVAPVSRQPVMTNGYDALDERLSAAAGDTARRGAATLQCGGWDATAEALSTRRSVWPALVDAAELRDAAVVVTGTRGHGPVVATLIGSVAEGVLRHAGRPVLIVPAP